MAMASPPTLLLLLFTLSFLIPYYLLHSVSAAICHADDEAGLLGFKSGINSDPSGILSTWKRGTDCCTWTGVRCNDSRVVTLNVYGDLDNPKGYLTGTISPSLAKLQNLTDITLLDLQNISGTFPSFLFDAPNLRNAYIGNSKLSGPLPADIGRLSRYVTLGLVRNQFTGSLPSSISQLTRLSTLSLGSNRLTGPIPDGIRKLTSLSYLDLNGNQLSGKIPDFFNSLRNLGVLHLSNNRFSGEIPASISTLAPRLTFLGLSHNILTGKIPDYFRNFKALERLYLSSNLFTGKIPDYFGNFKALDRLDLSSNLFSGVVPKTFKNLTTISRLNLSRNKLIDPFPEMNVTGIELIDLSYNQFKLGKIPKWVSSSPIIYSLKLAGCGIKMKFEDFKPMQTFYYNEIDLSDNQITGSPVQLLNQTNSLVEFLASGNQLKFNMSDLKLPTSLKDLDLSRNQIFGNVPVSISGLKTVNVSHNHLCGKLPMTKFPLSSFQGNDCLCGSPLPPCKS